MAIDNTIKQLEADMYLADFDNELIQETAQAVTILETILKVQKFRAQSATIAMAILIGKLVHNAPVELHQEILNSIHQVIAHNITKDGT